MIAGRALHPSVVREYDVRGVVGETLDAGDALAIGGAFAATVAADRGAAPAICLGFDGRLTSPALEAALAEGMAAAGAAVSRVGRGPTPMLYFAVHHLRADAGVMVTGSHNPPEYNGFKFMLAGGPFHGDRIRRLGGLAAAGAPTAGGGRIGDADVFDAYVETLAAACRGRGRLKAVWDPGNGAAGDVVRALARRLPGRHDVINGDVDGTFPAHHPDPTVAENLAQLRRCVEEGSRDVGIAFDGDGDRIGVIDDRGGIVWADLLLALLARGVLAARPGATVIADVKSSQVLFDEIARLGGNPVMWRTGHSLIRARMAETGAPLAGEMSGHLFFADEYYGFDDAVYAAVRLLDTIEESGESLSALRDRLPTLPSTPEMRFDCADDRKFGVVAEVRDRLASAGHRINDVDGVRVTSEDGWWLLRASNTQAMLVARCEARDEAALSRVRSALEAELSRSGIRLPG